MVHLQDVEQAVMQLPDNELRQFSHWFIQMHTQRLSQGEGFVTHLLNAPKGDEIDIARNQSDQGRSVDL